MILVRHGQSDFNVIYARTRQDPGIPDPGLTAEGRRQAAAAASDLAGRNIRQVLASPYQRTLHTASIIAGQLGLPVVIEPLIRERAVFVCDVGSPRSDLAARWPKFDFGDLPERWWPEPDESETELAARCAAFRTAQARNPDWSRVVVVSHWGFIRGLTGREVPNGASVHFDPTEACPKSR